MRFIYGVKPKSVRTYGHPCAGDNLTTPVSHARVARRNSTFPPRRVFTFQKSGWVLHLMYALNMTVVYDFLQKAAATSVVHLLINGILVVVTQHKADRNKCSAMCGPR